MSSEDAARTVARDRGRRRARYERRRADARPPDTRYTDTASHRGPDGRPLLLAEADARPVGDAAAAQGLCARGDRPSPASTRRHDLQDEQRDAPVVVQPGRARLAAS